MNIKQLLVDKTKAAFVKVGLPDSTNTGVTQSTKVEFGEMSWEKDDPMSISLTIQPDYCILNY